MSTPIQSGDKAAFIAIVNAASYPGGPLTASYLTSNMNNYEDVAAAIYQQLDYFSENVGYLMSCMACLTNDTALQSVGIYVGKTSNTTLVNPNLIINSTYTGGVNITADSPRLAILNASSINLITVSVAKTADWIYIGGGSSVDLVDSSAVSGMTAAQINGIYLPYQRSTPSSLKGAMPGSHIGNVFKEDGSYYGGILNYDPQTTCANPVTSLQALNITHDSVELSWALPASAYSFITPYYREVNSLESIKATTDIGFYMQNVGFVFTKLKPDTFYEFLVRVKCNNGGISDTTIVAKTPCCAGSEKSGYKFCAVVCLIRAAPDPTNVQTLCNGVTIPKEYLAGTTLTVGYLGSVYAEIVTDLVLENVPYQLMPYNRATGTFDASTTPILAFPADSTVTFGVSIPA